MAEPTSSGAVGRIIDAHHHLWAIAGPVRYPWLESADAAGEPGPLHRDYLATDLVHDAGSLPLVASVHVEAAAEPADAIAETRWLQDQATAHDFPQAIVAHVNLARDDVDEQLDAQAQSANVRGVRHMLDRDLGTGRSQETQLMTDPVWRRGLARLGARDLVFDLQVLPSQLDVAARLADDFGDITFALNHGGYHVPGSSAMDALWRNGIERIGRCPNVVVKASGYDTVDPTWPQRGVDDYVGTLLSHFGADRVLFASNFPIDGLTISWPDLVEADLHAIRGLDAAERDAFFFGNAARVYLTELVHT
jgi:predicted TIM-barrel fold metal-dependent hydrolase